MTDAMMRLATLLTEALALADSIDLPIVAIHIDEALSHMNANFPADNLLAAANAAPTKAI